MKAWHMACVLLLFFTTSAWAQSSDEWDWRIAPYLWAVNISGELAGGFISQNLDVEIKLTPTHLPL